MKPKQRFLIAKYAPDVRRMEPRNIGVILWANGNVGCRFLPDDVVTFVNDIAIYRRWVRFWSKIVTEKQVAIAGKPQVSHRKPEFLDAIKATESGSYFLFEGGHVLDDVSKESLNDAVSVLFDSLVLPTDARTAISNEPKDEPLRAICERLLNDAGLSSRDDFSKRYPLRCQVDDIDVEITFDFALGNGRPSALYQMVRLDKGQSVNSAAFMFEQAQNRLPKENLAAIIDADHDDLSQPEYKLMSHYATVLNVSQYEHAKRMAQAVAQAVPQFHFDKIQ